MATYYTTSNFSHYLLVVGHHFCDIVNRSTSIIIKTVDKELLKKFLDGDCTAEEALTIKDLLLHPDAQEVMQELTCAEWDEPVRLDEETTNILESWKKKVNTRIVLAEQEKRRGLQADFRLRKMYFLRYAAILIGILLVSAMVIQIKKTNLYENMAYIQKTNKQGQPIKYTLPDSSQVFLGAGSRLRYPEHFSGITREIELQGEAFFQVKHNSSMPFIIHTGEIHTSVLGTSFKVQAFDGQPLVVSVATGKVMVSRHNSGQAKTLAFLTPGLKVTWNSLTCKAIQDSVDIFSLKQWKLGNMVFEEQTMEQIASELQRRYAVKIDIIDKEISGNQVSGTFPAVKTIDKVMNTLEIAGKFRYETNDNKYFKIYKTE